MHAFLTKGLTQTASLWADVEQGYAWVHQAAHLLSNDQKQTAAEVRQAYETLLAQLEQAPTPSEPLAVMLSTFRHPSPPVIGPASFTATIYQIFHAPTMTSSSISAQRAIMNDEQPDANRRHQG
jgi:hypothetical protein